MGFDDTITLVGRGFSAYEADWPDLTSRGPIMAVSSGIFALPETVMPAHFVTLDQPKFFLESLTPGVSIAWQEDKLARFWPFWREPSVHKHTLVGNTRNGRCKHFPGDAIDNIPEEHQHGFMRAISGKLHEFGYQPMWGDYPSVTGWPMKRTAPPNFGYHGQFGLRNPEDPNSNGLCNSLLFAIQVAARLEYKNMIFVGVDLQGDWYLDMREMMKIWQREADRHGIRWFNASPRSELSEFMQPLDNPQTSRTVLADPCAVPANTW